MYISINDVNIDDSFFIEDEDEKDGVQKRSIFPFEVEGETEKWEEHFGCKIQELDDEELLEIVRMMDGLKGGTIEDYPEYNRKSDGIYYSVRLTA